MWKVTSPALDGARFFESYFSAVKFVTDLRLLDYDISETWGV